MLTQIKNMNLILDKICKDCLKSDILCNKCEENNPKITKLCIFIYKSLYIKLKTTFNNIKFFRKSIVYIFKYIKNNSNRYEYENILYLLKDKILDEFKIQYSSDLKFDQINGINKFIIEKIDSCIRLYSINEKIYEIDNQIVDRICNVIYLD